MEIYDEIDLKQKELDISVRALRRTGTEYANAERNYIIITRFILSLFTE